MPPKPPRRFVPIQMPAGGRGARGGRGGRGAGRDSSPEEDNRDSIPLVRRQASITAQKRKSEQATEQPPAKKAASKAGTAVPASTLVNLIFGRVAEVGSSSLRPKIYKQLTLPEMVSGLEPFAKIGW